VRNSIEIPTANKGFLYHDELVKRVDKCLDNDGQHDIRRLAPKIDILPIWLSVVVADAWEHFLRAWRGRKSRICRWNFNAIYHSSKDIRLSISRSGGHILFPVVGRYCNHLPTRTVFELSMVVNPRFAVGIRSYMP